MLDCTGLVPSARGRVLLKLEKFNAAGSVKDRVALHVIERAERAGLLRPGGTIVESSSGNLGIALAFLGAARGYRVIVIVDPKAARQSVAIMRAYGAEVVVESRRDSTGNYHETRIERARELERTIPGAYWVNQTNNRWNAEAHALSTAREIVRDCGDSLRACVTAVSSGGHVAGIATALHEHDRRIRAVGVDVRGSAIFASQGYPYLIPGMGLSWRPSIIPDGVPDDVYLLGDEDCCGAARYLARRGLLVGPSSGAVFLVCARLAREAPPGATIAGVLADGGERYTDSVFSDAWLADHGLRPWSGEDGLVRAADRLRALEPALEAAT